MLIVGGELDGLTVEVVGGIYLHIRCVLHSTAVEWIT